MPFQGADSAEPAWGVQRPEPSSRAARAVRDYWPLAALVAIMAAAFLIRLYYLGKHSMYTADSYYFLVLARSLKETFTYTVRGVTHTKYLPGFPIVTWLLGYAFGGIERAANMTALLGGTLTVLFTYLIGEELFDRWAGLAAAALVAVMPTFIKWTSLPMTEGLFTMLFSAGVYLLITGCRRASIARRLIGAAAGGLCLLTRWEGVLFLPLMVLIGVLYYKESGLRWWEPLVMLALLGVPIGVYVVRNLVATGKITAYQVEYEQHKELTFSLLKQRAHVYWWEATSSALFAACFYAGALWCLVSRRWKAFLVVGGWFALFAAFHMLWYYTYERFMAPAAPAVALMTGFLLWRLAVGARDAVSKEGWIHDRLAKRFGSGRLKAAARPLLIAGVVVSCCLFAVLVVHGAVRANTVTKENYLAFADDHGGSGMKDAAEWLKANAPGKVVAADAGPYFNWVYDGDVLYTRPVPWDLPVEDRDVNAPDLVRKLYERGVRYMVVGQTDNGVDSELETLALRQVDREHIREVARFTHQYLFPKPHEMTTVIYELLPRGQN